MAKLDERVARDFAARPQQEQDDFLQNTWCDACQKENLGMSDVCEYALEGTVYIEGKCKRCSAAVITEITADDF
ncbi:MAG: hypothetical protein ACPG4U_07550 [Pseudomonadales bacterium]